jgi:pyruvate/2-oxoglutarate dehydrogenase complex dihydrolipoamide dehydrogenase (E3) component
MTASGQRERHRSRGATLDLATDVLVIGGGPAAAWAAVAAAAAGARVDALYVAPGAEGPTAVCEAEIEAAGLFGSYARALGWRRRKPGGTDKDPTFRLRAAAR